MLAGWRAGDLILCRVDPPIDVRGRPGPSPLAADSKKIPRRRAAGVSAAKGQTTRTPVRAAGYSAARLGPVVHPDLVRGSAAVAEIVGEDIFIPVIVIFSFCAKRR